jgi:hypothetical protein
MDYLEEHYFREEMSFAFFHLFLLKQNVLK